MLDRNLYPQTIVSVEISPENVKPIDPFEIQSAGSSTSDDTPPPRKPTKRVGPTNGSKIRRPVHVISDSDDDIEVVVRRYRTKLSVKESRLDYSLSPPNQWQQSRRHLNLG